MVLLLIPAADATKQRPKLLKRQAISGATGKEQQQLQYLNQKFRPENALHAIRARQEMLAKSLHRKQLLMPLL